MLRRDYFVNEPEEFDWSFHKSLVVHYFPSVTVEHMTLGEFYGVLENIVKIEKWKRGDSKDSNKPMSPEEWIEAAKRGEISPDMETKKAEGSKPMTNAEQENFLTSLGIRKPTGA